MNFTEYQEFTETTAVYPPEMGVLYPILGAVGEIGEFAEKILNTNSPDNWSKENTDIKKELGDIFWYITRICAETELSLDGLVKSASVVRVPEKRNVHVVLRLTSHINSMSECIKKVYRDKNGKISGEDLQVIGSKIVKCLAYIDHIAYNLESSLSEIMRLNVKKLLSRKTRGVLQGNGDER